MQSYTIRIIVAEILQSQIIEAIGVGPAYVGNAMFWANTTRDNVDRIAETVRTIAPDAIITITNERQR